MLGDCDREKATVDIEITPEMMAITIKGDKCETVSRVFSTKSALSKH